MIKFFMPLIISAVIFLSGCAQEDTPEAALDEIKIALAERNSVKLAARADLEKFFSATYDATTLALAKNHDAYQKKYPDDPYFQHSADFLMTYNAEHKNLHLNFLRGVRDSFFAKMPEPENPEDNPTAYVASEFEKIRQAANATIKEVIIEDNRATMTLLIEGDNSLRGKFIGREMIFKLGFSRDEKNRWHFDEIQNLDELMPVLVDKAELVWITFS